MADHQQRIHPVPDVEASPHTPSAPLFPRDVSKSDHGVPVEERAAPAPALKKRRSRSCCCKFLCWIISLLLILIVAIGITIGILFLVFRPKLPKYSIDGLTVTRFSLSEDNNLSATFNVTVTARNPNKKIGIYYEGGSHVSAWYMDTKLCEGSLPKFYQGHKNTTVLHLPLSGQIQNATELQAVIQEQMQQTGNIPLNLRAKQPVRIKLGKLKLFKVKFKVRCRLVVDRLESNNEIKIVSSSCKFRLRL
ncbi:NDR1/HIN1-like protein 6 [Neltuma alba]|uniref:NDR1/HIN1-like protein 6 n=1 Tax=Neltuma alba TaxID=207710 RepID=UPI0010A3C172|nr:NDR1/HIN1-like protein 6 [Prosopis alba]XP_028768862.1 NDR1/HIN1-like protein 6 [Prosopis alba]XP_028769019.1 NDR1/HIN1-like protein 6 [Prosopis alba]